MIPERESGPQGFPQQPLLHTLPPTMTSLQYFSNQKVLQSISGRWLPLRAEVHLSCLCCPCGGLPGSPCWLQGVSAAVSSSLPIIRVPASTEGVNSAKAPPHSGSSLPPSLPLLPLSSSLPFPPQLHGSLGRCRLQPPHPTPPPRPLAPGRLARPPPTLGLPEIQFPSPTPAHAPALELRGC